MDRDALGATQALDHALSADDAVYAVSSAGSCPDDCAYRVLVSSDGQEWRPMANPIPNADVVNDLGFDDGRYVAVGMASERAAIWSSLGGLWTQNDQGHIFDVEADGGPGLPPNTHASDNVPIFSVEHGPRGWLAGGSASCGNCQLQPGGTHSRYAAWTSPNGLFWERQPWQATGPYAIERLASDGGSYVAINGNSVWHSTDAQQWQQHVSVDPMAGHLIEVAALGRDYLVVGLAIGQGVELWHSVGGEEWDQLPPSADLTGAIPASLRALGGRWVIVGSIANGGHPLQMMWSSADGLRWTSQVITFEPDARVKDVGAIGETVAAIGWVGDGGPSTVGAAWVGSLP